MRRGQMIDDAPKDWLRPTPSMFRRLLRLLVDMLMLAAFLFLLAWIINWNEARAAGTVMVLLETSSEPATFAECQRARPDLGRPARVISKQNGSGTNWHHRICSYI